MAARWKITSGRSATSFSANPGTAKSPVTVSTGNPTFPGFAGATTSCSVIRVMSRLPSRPSRNSRSVNLRPTIPAAPKTRMCKSQLLFLFLNSRCGPARSLFHRSGHRRDVVLDKKRVENDQRQRSRQCACHQRTPAIDVAVDEFVDDRDRYRLVLSRLQEGERV